MFQPLMGFMIDRFTSGLPVAAYARTFQMVFVVVIGMVLISLFIPEPKAGSAVNGDNSSKRSSVTEEAKEIA